MVALTEAGVAAVIGAAFSGIAGILAGVAAIIAAKGRRQTQAVHDEVTTTNGRTIAETLSRIEGDLVEHLRDEGRHVRP